MPSNNSQTGLPFTILFEDKNVLVIDKPAGLLSQGDASNETNLVDVLRGYFGRHYVGLVHRLDRNTSGVMVVAKRSKAADRLTEQLKSGELQRGYQALLVGRLEHEAKWEHYLVKDEAKNQTRVYNATRPDAKRALLKVRPIALAQNLTLAGFELETGRSHQIRAQAAHMGHPLLGDTKYAGQDKSASLPRFGRPALHSVTLTFEHPIEKTKMQFEAPLPRDISEILKKYEFKRISI